MANNYLLFSEMLEFENKEEFEWAKKELTRLKEMKDENDTPMLDFHWEIEENDEKKVLWFYTDEFGEPYKVGDFVQEYLKKFHPKDIWTLTWASTCSRPRIGEFAGGGMVVTATDMHFMEAHDWVSKTVAELKKGAN